MAYQANGTTIINNSKKGTFRVLNIGNYNNSNKPTSPAGRIYWNSSTATIEWA